MNHELEADYDSRAEAETAARELRLRGFRPEAIHVSEAERGIFGSLVTPPARVGVTAPGRQLEAAAILHRHGGRSPEEQRSGDASAAPERVGPGGEALPLLEERLLPDIQLQPVGELRVVKRVVAEKRAVEVTLRREEVQVERVELPAGNGSLAAAADGVHALGADQELVRIPLYEERPVVRLETVQYGEVVVRKSRVTSVERVEADVRREVPVVESEGSFPLEDRTAAAGVRPAERGRPASASSARPAGPSRRGGRSGRR